jgi:hypothetical protein
MLWNDPDTTEKVAAIPGDIIRHDNDLSLNDQQLHFETNLCYFPRSNGDRAPPAFIVNAARRRDSPTRKMDLFTRGFHRANAHVLE